MTFDVLFVCSGNICRSPMAERLFLARVPRTAPVRAASAGTTGLTGHEMDAACASVLRELGGRSDGHVARRVDAGLAGSAALVLTADSAHRAAVLAESPLLFRRVFTMREFARLGAGREPLDEVTVEGLTARVQDIAGARGFVAAAGPGGDDIGDPFGAPMDVVREAGRAISEAVDAAIAALGLAQPRPLG